MSQVYKSFYTPVLRGVVLFLSLGFVACEKAPELTDTYRVVTVSDQNKTVSDPPSLLVSRVIENASLPNIFKDEQGVNWLSYVTHNKQMTTLWLSQWVDDDWSEPEKVAQGENWFVNWADFPSVTKNYDDFVAHWLQKNGSGTYAYGVQYAIKQGLGHWEARGLLHTDNSPTEHGFVSMTPSNKGTHAVWLDGRHMQASGGHDSHSHSEEPKGEAFDINSIKGMTLRYGLIGKDGEVTHRQVLDSLTCDCCQTTTTMSQEGLVVAYRDREVIDAHSEIRDIKVLRQQGSSWVPSENTPVDHWDIQACPVNGPVLTSNKNRLALVWFTAAEQHSKVKVAFSSDNGRSFGSVHNVDALNNLGRVGADWLDEENLLVSWIGMHDQKTQLMYRIIKTTGEMSESQVVSNIDMSRSSGVPQVTAISAEKALFVWTQSGNISSIQTRLLTLQ